MIALITGASSGIGRDIAKELAKKSYDIIEVARNEDELKKLKVEIEEKNKVNVYIKACDLSNTENCTNLYKEVKNEFKNIDILVNNAGFGLCGKFTDTDLAKEVNMINTNITALHVLTKLFLNDMVETDKGIIMNVASIAGFMPGPLMATYYSTKAYVVRLTQSIREELKKQKSNVKINVLCPGPVDTNFNKVANVKFTLKGQSSEYCAKIAVKKMFKNRTLIFTSNSVWLYKNICKIFIPDKIAAKLCYSMQKRKI